MVYRDRWKYFLILLSLGHKILFALEVIPFLPKDKSSSLLYQSSNDQVKYISQNQNTVSLIDNSKNTMIYQSNNEISRFQIYATAFQKNVLLEVDDMPFLTQNPRKNKKIFWGIFKGGSVNELGEGAYPKLHLGDDWVSYYDFSKKSIIFHYLPLLGKNNYKIFLNNKSSPYFLPEVNFLEHEQIIYTDVNDKGEEALISLNLKTNNFIFLHKSTSADKKISHCIMDNNIVFGEFDSTSQSNFSLYHMTYNGEKSFSEKKNIFNDNGKYLPSLICSPFDKSIFVLKRSLSKSKFADPPTLLINISIPKGNSTELSLDRPFSQLLTMDSRLLLVSGGKFYQVVK